MKISVVYNNYNSDVESATITKGDNIVKFEVSGLDLDRKFTIVNDNNLSNIEMTTSEFREFHNLITHFMKQLSK